MLTPNSLHSQLSHTFFTLVPFQLLCTLSLSCPSLISAFRQPEGPRLLQFCIPRSFRMNTAGAQVSSRRVRMNGLVHSSVRTRPVFFQTSGPRGPSRFQIPDSRLPVRLQTPHRSRSRRRSFGSSVCSSMYVSEHSAHLVSNLGTPGRLSHSSVVLLSRLTFTRPAFVVVEMNSLQLDMDSIMPCNEGPGQL